MKRSIFSLSSVIAYLISLFFGSRAFIQVFETSHIDDPTEFLRSSFMSSGNIFLNYMPFRNIDLLWFSLLIQMTIIGVRFYAHAEAIDSNPMFISAESIISKISRTLWIAPALVLPTLMAVMPAANSSKYLLGIVSTALTIAYVSMSYWSTINMDKWIECQKSTSKLSTKRRLWLSVSDYFYLLGFLVLTVAIWLSKLYGLACIAFIFLVAICSLGVAISMIVFYGKDSRWSIYVWLVAIVIISVCASTFFRLIMTIS